MSIVTLFAVLVFCHALADYPLQGDFLAKAKSRVAPIPGVPWWIALASHAVIHGGFVWYVLGVWWLGLAEFVAHCIIDDTKCRGRISFATDQALHLTCKALWILLAVRVAYA